MVTRRGILAASALASVLMSVGCGRTAAPPGRAPDERVGYGPHPSQYLEVTLPAGDGAAPVVVVLHGGYWRQAYGAELGAPLAADLAARGFAAVNVEYRRVGGAGGWPQTGEDVLAAWDALAGRPRLDLGRAVALGHSAGGQLAGFLVAERPLRGAVLQAGVLDLVGAAEQGLGGGAVEQFLGGSPTDRPDVYARASPRARLPLRRPTIAVHGSGDDIVPPAQSADFVAAARAAGDPAELRAVPGDHFAPITVGSPAWAACVEAVTALTR